MDYIIRFIIIDSIVLGHPSNLPRNRRFQALLSMGTQVIDVLVHPNMSNVKDSPRPSLLESKLLLFAYGRDGHQPYLVAHGS